MRTRYALAAAGILLGLFGAFRLLTQISGYDLFVLACWLIGAILIHDGILSPVVVGIGAAISRVLPPRGRRYVQAGLVVAAMLTVIALPMIYRRDSQPRVKAILQQNYAANLGLLIGIVAAVSLVLYAIKVARESGSARRPLPGPGNSDQRPSAVNSRPPEDQSSSTT